MHPIWNPAILGYSYPYKQSFQWSRSDVLIISPEKCHHLVILLWKYLWKYYETIHFEESITLIDTLKFFPIRWWWTQVADGTYKWGLIGHGDAPNPDLSWFSSVKSASWYIELQWEVS